MTGDKKDNNNDTLPFVDLTHQQEEIEEEILRCIHKVIKSGKFILDENVAAFESEAAEYLEVEFAVGVASGTDALQLALIALDVGEGDEVITTPFSFIATAEVIRHVGAKPVFVDIDPRTFNLSTDHVEAAITDRTAAIMPAHIFGQPSDISELSTICNRHNIKLIEDCCQSFGAVFKGEKVGAFGDAGGFSFYPSKNLGALGDGGLVVTKHKDVADKIRMLRNHGSTSSNQYELLGFNSRLDEIQAAVLREKLKKIDIYNTRRSEIAHQYSQFLDNLPIVIPYEDPRGTHIFNQYTILSEQRDDIASALKSQNIASAVYYPIPLHKQPVIIKDQPDLALPIAEDVTKRCISLPIYPELQEECIRTISAAIRTVFEH
ncbi:MAG: DegT/DnrJ/EryC1/StrS family aminotransferase [Gammaproteobacteria bacterium]